MNLLYIKTFLEIASTRSFVQAAKNLNIAQSTVSARINHLEEELDQVLFRRNRAEFDITPAGLQFQKYALNLMRTWVQARQSMAIQNELRSVYRVCIQTNLWKQFIGNWIKWVRKKDSNAILEIETEFSPLMMDQLASGLLDIGVMYTPRKTQGLKTEQLCDEKLVMVSTTARKISEVDFKHYVYVEWGKPFDQMHSDTFSSKCIPGITVGMAPLALEAILQEGGSCYQSLGAVKFLINAKKLHIVEDAPVYPRPIYMVYPDDAKEQSRLKFALDGFRQVAKEITT